MKVLLVNGSPHKNGSTDRALQEVEKTLEAGGVETEIFWIGTEPVGGCIGCGGCRKKGECVFGGPVVEFTGKAKEADGFCVRKPGPLRGGVGQYDVVPGPRVLFGGCGRVPLQAGGGCDGSAPRRKFGGLRAVTQVPRHLAHADRLEPVLEHGARRKRAGRRAGPRGSADHARTRAQYGVAASLHRGGQRPRASSRLRSSPSSAQISFAESKCYIPGGKSLAGIFFAQFYE